MKAQKPTDRLPPFCPGCCEEGVRWKTVSKNVEQEYRGDTFYVKADVSACADCGFEIGTDEQVMAIVTATRNAYRQKQGLLSSEEIRERRKALGMSQREFAEFVGVGVASLKRWEAGLVQEKSGDELIRAKTTQTDSAGTSLRDELEATLRSNVWLLSSENEALAKAWVKSKPWDSVARTRAISAWVTSPRLRGGWRDAAVREDKTSQRYGKSVSSRSSLAAVIKGGNAWAAATMVKERSRTEKDEAITATA